MATFAVEQAMKYVLIDIVDDTLTNAEGAKLYALLDKSIADENILELSFHGTTALSSSFLNSSIGNLLDKYDFEHFKGFVKFVDLRQSVANQLLDYLRSCDLQV